MPADQFAGRKEVMALVLDDGTWLWPSSDDEATPTYEMSIIVSDAKGTDWVLNEFRQKGKS